MTNRDLIALRSQVQAELQSSHDSVESDVDDYSWQYHQEIGYQCACLTILNFIESYIGPDFEAAQ